MKKVLIVLNDSDPLLARVCKNKFETQDGWMPEISSDYDSALEKIKSTKPNLLITEIILNDSQSRTGFDLISEIRKEEGLNETKILVFSDLSQESDKEKAKELGADYYFVKSETTILGIIEAIKEVLK